MKLNRLAPVVAAAVILSASTFTTDIAQASPTQVVNSLRTSGESAGDLATFFRGDTTPINSPSFGGSDLQIGKFDNFRNLIDTAPTVPLSGVALSTGLLNTVTGEPGLDLQTTSALPGPNNEDTTGADIQQLTGIDTGEPLLTGLVGRPTHDASSLEFDFTALSDRLQFEWIFGSEEYLTFVGLSWNDAFGVFLDDKNGTVQHICNDFYSVNGVNPGSRAASYRDNPAVTTGAPSNIDIGLNGITTLQQCRTSVVEGTTYRIKFVIADVQDYRIDSIFLLRASSFLTAFPKADDDRVTTPIDTPVTIPVTTNDKNAKAVTLITRNPTHGTVTINGLEVVYTPGPGFSGRDDFEYQIAGPAGTTAGATVYVTVPPTADPDFLEIPAGDPHGTIHVLENDNGRGLVVDDITLGTPSNGKVEITPDGKIKYTPNPGFSGDDEFEYTAVDHHGQTVTTKVAVKVHPLAPVPPVVQQIKTGGTVLQPGFSPIVGLVLSFAIGVSAVALRRLRYA